MQRTRCELSGYILCGGTLEQSRLCLYEGGVRVRPRLAHRILSKRPDVSAGHDRIVQASGQSRKQPKAKVLFGGCCDALVDGLLAGLSGEGPGEERLACSRRPVQEEVPESALIARPWRG